MTETNLFVAPQLTCFELFIDRSDAENYPKKNDNQCLLNFWV